MKAYGRPAEGGRGGSVPFPVPDDPRFAALVTTAADPAAALREAHRGLA